MKIALALLCAFELLDGLLTRWAVTNGIADEWNPIVAANAANWSFVLLKLAGAAACVALLWTVHRRFPRMAMISTNVVVAFYVAVLLWNATTIVRS